MTAGVVGDFVKVPLGATVAVTAQGSRGMLRRVRGASQKKATSVGKGVRGCACACCAHEHTRLVVALLATVAAATMVAETTDVVTHTRDCVHARTRVCSICTRMKHWMDPHTLLSASCAIVWAPSFL